MKKLIIVILSLSFVIIACERFYIFPDARIRGSVIDSTTFGKIPYAKVTVYRNVHCSIGNLQLCDDWEIVKSEESDSKGNFKLNFNDDGKEYRISASKEGYYKSGFWYKVSKDREEVDCYLFLTLAVASKNNLI